MADKRISDLNALTVTASDDTALVSDTSASETKKITLANFFKTPYVGTPQALSGAGAANLTTSILKHHMWEHHKLFLVQGPQI